MVPYLNSLHSKTLHLETLSPKKAIVEFNLGFGECHSPKTLHSKSQGEVQIINST